MVATSRSSKFVWDAEDISVVRPTKNIWSDAARKAALETRKRKAKPKIEDAVHEPRAALEEYAKAKAKKKVLDAKLKKTTPGKAKADADREEKKVADAKPTTKQRSKAKRLSSRSGRVSKKAATSPQRAGG